MWVCRVDRIRQSTVIEAWLGELLRLPLDLSESSLPFRASLVYRASAMN